jgi:hypothetical protein
MTSLTYWVIHETVFFYDGHQNGEYKKLLELYFEVGCENPGVFSNYIFYRLLYRRSCLDCSQLVVDGKGGENLG